MQQNEQLPISPCVRSWNDTITLTKLRHGGLNYKRIVSFLSCVLLSVFVHDTFAVNYTVSQGVPGVIQIKWTPVSGAVSYNIHTYTELGNGMVQLHPQRSPVATGLTHNVYNHRTGNVFDITGHAGIRGAQYYNYYIVTAVYPNGLEVPNPKNTWGLEGWMLSSQAAGKRTYSIVGDSAIAPGEKKRYERRAWYEKYGSVDVTDDAIWHLKTAANTECTFAKLETYPRGVPLLYLEASKVASKQDIILWTSNTSDDFATSEKRITVYPVKVTFDLGTHGTRSGGGELEQYMDIGENAKAPNIKVEKGWVFMGWSPSSLTKVKKSMTVKAVYKRIRTVSFNANGGSGTMAAQTFTNGVQQVLRANKFKCEGKNFVGWATSAKGSAVYSNKQSVAVSSDLTLYAKWQAKTYKVTYKPGRKGVGSQQKAIKTHGKALTLKGETFTCSDSKQTGWSTSDGGTKEYKLSASYTKDTAVTLYPVWKANTYIVTFKANGGAGIMSVQSFTAGKAKKLNANTFAFPGHVFKGWATSASGNVVYSDGQSIAPSANLTLYAVWDAVATFTIVEGVLTGVNLNGTTNVVIPGSVTSIGASVFENCTNLRSVTIPASVTSIGDSAFKRCSGLTSVTIPDSVTSIGASAFSRCSGLTSVTIPDSVTSIGASAFSWCSDSLFDRTTIPGVKLLDGWVVGSTASISSELSLYGVRGICDSAFSGSTNLTSVTIPDGVSSIGASAFNRCGSLKSVIIPDSVTSIGASAFNRCGSLKSVIIPDSVTSIGASAFEGCTNLMSVTIPDSVTGIGDSAFCGCGGLTRVTIPDAVTSIGSYMFCGCRGLTSVTIPYGVTNVEDHAFFNCTGLMNVTIPDSVTSIGHSAFEYCPSLTSVTIPDSVTSIGYSAFLVCSESLFDTTTIPGVKLVDGWVVGYTASIASELNLSGVRGICGSAFSGCTNLTSMMISASVTNIGVAAFSNCSGLRSIMVDSRNDRYSSVNGLLLSKDGKTLVQGVNGDVTIPNGVTSIGAYAFFGCTDLMDLRLPLGVTNIGDYAFYNCMKGSIWLRVAPIFPVGVTNIVNNVFYSEGLVTDVTIPDGVISIGSHAFYGCSGLTSVTIPDSVTSIGDYAFFGCYNRQYDRHYYVKDEGLESVTIGNGVANIGDYAFSKCQVLTNVTIGSGVKEIGNYAFSGCSKLGEVTIPNSVTSIGLGAFGDCDGLGRIRIYDKLGHAASVAEALDGSPADIEIIYEEALRYTVTFDANGGTVLELTRGVDDGTSVGPLPMPTRVGYAFDGWWTEANGGSQMSEATCVTDDVTVYAHWTPAVCAVTYKPGANGSGMSLTTGKAWDSPLPLMDSIFSRSGYVQAGWSTSDGGPKAYDLSADYTSNADLTLYPFWLVGTCNVQLEKNGGSGGDNYVTATYLEPMPTLLSAPTKAGCIFDGYWSTSGSDGVQYYDNCMDSVHDWDGEAAILWARWRTAAVVHVAFEKNGGSGGEDSVICTEGQSMPVLSALPTKEGCTFDGYWTSADMGGDQYYDEDLLSVRDWDKTSATTLYAKWSPASETMPHGTDGETGKPIFTIEEAILTAVDLNGATDVVVPDTVTEIGPNAFYGCTNLTSVTITDGVTSIWGFAFGRCTSLTNVTIPDSVTNIVDAAFYGCSELAHVIFNGNAPIVGNQAFDGVACGCTAYVKRGSTGWGVDIPGTWNGLKIRYQDEPDVYVVTFDANGGTGVMGVQTFTDGVVQALTGNAFTFADHKFAGWATSADGGVLFADGQDIIVSSDMTLYAKWMETIAGWAGVSFTKAQTAVGALYTSGGTLVGTVQVKFGKVSKKGIVKISGNATLLIDGKSKKVSAKAVKVGLAATGLVPPVTLAFKAPIGEMAFAMEADGTFTLKNGNYVMVEKKVGGDWSKAGAKVYVDGGRGATALPAGTIEELLPDGEPVIPKGGKWSFAKAAGVKYAKDKKTTVPSLVVDTKKGTNLSAMKLTYVPKTGIFKGAFKIYAIQGGKLKKFTVKVIGVVVDGKGWGSATGPGAVRFVVTVE